jgi:hypothetical protein
MSVSSTEREMSPRPDGPRRLRNVEQRRAEITALELIFPGELIERRTHAGPSMKIPVPP